MMLRVRLSRWYIVPITNKEFAFTKATFLVLIHDYMQKGRHLHIS